MDESLRVRRLRDLGLLDSASDDPELRNLVEQARAALPGATIAAVSLVDENRQWFKSIVGLDVAQTDRSVSFCSHTIRSEGEMVVEDATQDPRFCDNARVTAAPHIRFYAGVKLFNDVGALCVIGVEPRKVTADEMEKIRKIARYVDMRLMAEGLRNRREGA